jgi:hypothetical protein
VRREYLKLNMHDGDDRDNYRNISLTFQNTFLESNYLCFGRELLLEPIRPHRQSKALTNPRSLRSRRHRHGQKVNDHETRGIRDSERADNQLRNVAVLGGAELCGAVAHQR